MVPGRVGPRTGAGPACWPRRGAEAGCFSSSLRIFCVPVPMRLSLPPPLLLLLFAALAATTTTFRPDWNRLHRLARGRVEVSALAL